MKNLTKNLLLVFLTVIVAATALLAVGCGGKKAELSFETNGVSSMETVEVKKETTYALTEPAHDKTYSFEGWYLTADFSGSPVTEVTVTEDMTVYAKWEKLYALTLNLEGGSLSKETTLYLKKGVKISDALQGYEPTKTGYKFGAWYNGDRELNKNLKMGETAVTLTAKYKAPYTVETYKQNATLTGYDKTEEVKYEYVGKTVKAEDSLTGFSLVDNENSKNSLVVSENAADNVVKAYYDRNKVSVYFNSNNPDGSASQTVGLDAYYGVETNVPEASYFTFAGYFLKGWADSTGNLLYESNFLQRKIQNNNELDSFSFEKSMSLYAVWERGYTDIFGGVDNVFVVDTKDEYGDDVKVVYLSRGGFFFEGTYVNTPDYNIVFDISEENKLFVKTYAASYTFVYADSNRNSTYSRFVNGTGIDKNETLEFDNYNGVTYKVITASLSQSTGEYIVLEDEVYGEVYQITFTEGELAGSVYMAYLTQYEKNNVFVFRNDEDVELGKLTKYAVYDGQLVSYKIYQVEFDGYLTAKYYTDLSDATVYETYSYFRNDDTYTLRSNQTQIVIKVTKENGQNVYYDYNQTLDRTIENADGTKLTLDGLRNLTYNDGTKELSGIYSTTSSVFGGYIVSAKFDNGSTSKFLVKSYTESSEMEGEEAVVKYSFTKKLDTYKEYYYADNGTAYLAPLIVVDDEKEGWASLYGYMLLSLTERTYAKVAEGQYIAKEFSDLNTGDLVVYTLTVNDADRVDPAPNVYELFFDLTTVKTIVFSLDSQTFGYSLAYWYQVTDLEGNTTTLFNESYKNGDETLVMLGQRQVNNNALSSIALYTKGGEVTLGITSESVTSGTSKEDHYKQTSCVATFFNGKTYQYLELNHEDNTFVTLQHAPYVAYDYMGGNADGTVYISFDGKGNATYTKVTLDEDKKVTDTKTIQGKAVDTNKVSLVLAVPVFKFVSNEGEEELSFAFIRFTNSNYVFYSTYNFKDEVYGGLEYTNGNGEYLKLDGFGYYGAYTSAEGDEYRGYYEINGNEVSLLSLTTVRRYFFFKMDGNNFSVRGDEYAGSDTSAYIIFDNQRMVGQYIFFDGFGNAKLFTFTTNDEGESVRKYIDENATYTVKDGVITVNYNDGEERTYVGKISTFALSGNNYLSFELTRTSDIIKAYVDNSEWSVLVLDDIGRAVRYHDKGETETGTYKLITETLMYYVNDAGTDACIYKFDPQNGTITLCETRPYSYYSQDLDTLTFTTYGFVIENGEFAYYYTADKGDVTLYHYDPDGENPNDYGFVKENFGKLDTTISYKSTDYYRHGLGSLTFNRYADNADKYPVQGKQIKALEFSPVGGESYVTTAKVTLAKEGEKDDVKECYVVKDADGMHLLYDNFKFDITLHYDGLEESNCTYVIDSMAWGNTAYAYGYISQYFYYLLFGYAPANNYGTISFINEYNEKGEVVKEYATAKLGEILGYVDSEGNAFTFDEEQEYKYDSSTGYYTVTKTMADGYEYQLIFQTSTQYGISYFMTLAFVRVENLVTDDYTVTVKRVIASDRYTVGSYWDISLKVGETTVAYTEAYIISTKIVSFDGGIAYVVREFDGTTGKVTKSTHYYIALTEKTDGSVEGSTNKVNLYEKAVVTKTENTVYYTEDGKSFIEVCGDNVLSLVTQTVKEKKDGDTTIKTASYQTSFFTSSEKTGDNAYTAKIALKNGTETVYNLTVQDGVLKVTKVEDTEETA